MEFWEYYRKKLSCLLRCLFLCFSCRATEWPFWFGHILPFCLIYIFNWAVFAVITTSLFMRKIPSQDKKQRIKRVKQNIVVAIGLSVLFGLGWGFGLTATSSSSKEVTFVFQVIFSVFVGAQGIVIFILHGLRSQESRKVWENLCICLSFKGEYHPSSSTKDKKTNSSTIPMTGLSENQYSSTCQSGHSMHPFTNKSEAKGIAAAHKDAEGKEATEHTTVKIDIKT